MQRFLARKLITYLLAFFVGVTIDWGIPHLMPGDPIQNLLSKFNLQPASYAALYKTFAQAFGTNLPLWQQYLNYWKGMLTGDMGISIYDPPAKVTTLVFQALPYTLALLVPAIVLSYVIGNRLGARGRAAQVARQHRAPRWVRLPGDPVPVAGAGHALPLRRRLAHLPHVSRLR